MFSKRILPVIAAVLLVVYLGILGAQFLTREREITRTAPLESVPIGRYPGASSSETEASSGTGASSEATASSDAGASSEAGAAPIAAVSREASSEASAAQVPPVDAQADYGFEFSSLSVKQGGFAILTVHGAARADGIRVSSSLGVDPVWGPAGDGLAALFPIRFNCPVGEYLVAVEGGGHREEFLLNVADGEFPVQYLEIDDSIADDTIRSTAANDEYMAKAQPIKSLWRGEALWDGPFILPVEGGWRSTEFGSIRYVNGVYTEQHGGTDIAVPLGTPARAANRGEVVFAEFLQLTGNTVAIEHGLGLKTWYYHMDSLAVSAGDTVEKGDLIGEVGSTGFSTGAHMHFGASIGTVWIDPDLLLDERNLPS